MEPLSYEAYLNELMAGFGISRNEAEDIADEEWDDEEY